MSNYITENNKLTAKKLADKFLMENNFFILNNEPYIYENGVYSEVDENIIKSRIGQYLPDWLYTTRNVSEVYSLLNMTTAVITLKNLHARKNLINTRNCFIEVKNEQVETFTHDPKVFTINQFNVEYNDKNTETPQWQEFLDSCLEKDDQVLLQEILGYILIPETRAKKLFMFVGPKDCGKSTILEILRNIISDENVCAIDPKNLQPEYRFYTSELFGKLANICGDISNERLDPALLKQLLGEDLILADRKFNSPIKFVNKARCLFSCNEKPLSKDKTDAWFAKLIFLKFKKPEKKDITLKDRLKTELDGIFKWALDGLLRLKSNKFEFSLSYNATKEMEEYKKANNPLMCFVDDLIEFDDDCWVKSSEIYEQYKLYCKLNNLQALSNIKFFKFLQNQYNLKKKVIRRFNKTFNAVEGIKLTIDKMERVCIENESDLPLPNEM